MDSTAKVAETRLESTIRTERKRIFDFIRRRVGTFEDAEDILQDVFYQLAANYNIAEPIENLTAWLFTAARNKIIDWYRKGKLAPIRTSNHDSSGEQNPEEFLFDPSNNVETLYLQSLFWEELSEALDELPEEQKEVFVMHELEGKSFKEIAQLTGKGVNTLLSRKRYAVLFLGERLKEIYDEFQNL